MAIKDYIRTPLNIVDVGSAKFVVDENDKLVEVNVSCEVNYGNRGYFETIDIMSSLAPLQKQKAQDFYDTLKSQLNKIVLG